MENFPSHPPIRKKTLTNFEKSAFYRLTYVLLFNILFERVAAVAQQVEHVLGKDATCLKKDFRKIIKNTLKKGYAVMAQ